MTCPLVGWSVGRSLCAIGVKGVEGTDREGKGRSSSGNLWVIFVQVATTTLKEQKEEVNLPSGYTFYTFHDDQVLCSFSFSLFCYSTVQYTPTHADGPFGLSCRS